MEVWQLRWSDRACARPPFNEAIFGGPAKRESRGGGTSAESTPHPNPLPVRGGEGEREGEEEVIVPNVSRFGEKQHDGQ